MFRVNLFWKFFGAFLALIALTAVFAGWLASSRVRENVERQANATLRKRLDLLCELFVDALPGRTTPALQERLRDLGEGLETRITLIGADGAVVGDSAEDPAGMDNHATRPEVLGSRGAEIGHAQRHSATLGLTMIYMARALRDGETLRGYVRGAMALGDLEDRLARLRNSILGAAGLAVLVGLAGAFVAARRLSRPLRSMRNAAMAIAAGDYERRVRTSKTDEIGDLGGAFNEMASDLEREISTIRRDQREVTAILGGMVEGVLAVNHEGCVARVNDAACTILGVTADDVRGRPVWEALLPYKAPEALRRAVQQGETHSVVISLPAEGQVRTVLLHLSPLEASGDLLRGAVLVLNDITEHRRLEEVRRAFVANASHELKTPVASIRSMAETVLDDPAMDPEMRHTFLGRILSQSDRLGELIEEMLVLSRLETKGGELAGRGPLDVRDPVREALDDCQATARERSIGIRTEIADEDLIVSGQAEAIRRVAGNLLDNAIKYTPRGGWVTLRALRRDGAVVIEVGDTGFGIPADKHDRIFERFYRVDEGRSRKVGGTGLGLSIVKHFVQAMSGTIEVESVVGQGSTFRVALPAK